MKNPFRYFKTSPEIIRLAVMMYIRFPLSLRQVEDLLHERGIDICHETVVGPENSSQLILLKKLVYRAMLQTYELCVFFHDHFLDGRVPLPTVPAA